MRAYVRACVRICVFACLCVCVHGSRLKMSRIGHTTNCARKLLMLTDLNTIFYSVAKSQHHTGSIGVLGVFRRYFDLLYEGRFGARKGMKRIWNGETSAIIIFKTNSEYFIVQQRPETHVQPYCGATYGR